MGPEHGSDQSRCQGCLSLGYTHCQAGRDHGQVKQGCTHSALLLFQALPGMASPGSVGQMFTSCHQEAVHLYDHYMPAEKAASLHPASPLPSKKKPYWVCLSLKHRTLTDWDLSSSPPSRNICFGPGPSEHKESVPSWADVSYKELHKRQCGELISVPRRQRTRRSQRRGRLVRTKTSRKRPTHRTAPWSFLSVSSTAALYSVPATCQGSHT